MVRSRPRNRGSTLVEFCLVLPVFLLLIFGILDFGRFYFVQHTIQFATREGMRVALVGRRLLGENSNPMSREDSIIRTIRENASTAINPSSLSVYIYPVSTDYGDPAGWDKGGPNAGNPGVYMRVRSRYTYDFLTPLIGAFFTNGILVEAQGTYRNELFDA